MQKDLLFNVHANIRTRPQIETLTPACTKKHVACWDMLTILQFKFSQQRYVVLIHFVLQT